MYYSHTYSPLQFDRVCRLFCEDPVTTQSDEFFGIFDYYITNFLEAKQENDAIKRKREEEEKMAKQQQEVHNHYNQSKCKNTISLLFSLWESNVCKKKTHLFFSFACGRWSERRAPPAA